MIRLFRYILMALASSMLLISLQSCKEEGIIEEDTMAQIYAEMLLTDQWINSTPGMRMIADTSLVYEPILKKYGHTSVDYRKSVEYYLNDPDTYADIMKKTVKIFDNRLSDLHKKKDKLQEEKDREKFVKSMASKVNLNDSLFAVTYIHDKAFGSDDSLSIEWDSLSFYYKFVRIPREIQVDTLCVADSLDVADTLAAVDTLAVLDTLKPLSLSKETIKNPGQLNVDKTLFKKKK